MDSAKRITIKHGVHMFIDTMNISMKKVNENDFYVWYRFEINVETIPYIYDKKGRPQLQIEAHYGVFKFHKNESILDKAIEYEESETDEIIRGNSKILAKCLYIMVKCKENGYFPEIEHYACG